MPWKTLKNFIAALNSPPDFKSISVISFSVKGIQYLGIL